MAQTFHPVVQKLIDLIRSIADGYGNVSFTAQPGVHYKGGTAIGKAYPVVPPTRF